MAKDKYHNIVKQALEKEGWLITADPFTFTFGQVNFQVDLGAERIIAAEKDNKKIAVEIKSFLNSSAITDFYNALGQFLSYRLALQEIEPSRILYSSFISLGRGKRKWLYNFNKRIKRV